MGIKHSLQNRKIRNKEETSMYKKKNKKRGIEHYQIRLVGYKNKNIYISEESE